MPKTSKAEKTQKADAAAQKSHELAEDSIYPPVIVPVVLRPFQGFVDFVRQQGVIGLAVGLVLGTAAKEVVDAIVNSFVNPLLGLVLPQTDNLVDAAFSIGGSRFTYGVFLNVLIKFLSVAAVIYFIVHGLKLDKIDKKKA